ncbi:antitoxin VbhA family protein [Gordonia rubripertincta]|uniref:Antitoxin VbhA domain-containing protein n=1 Tax=Gordonia rubripertincta TaxID=36822 RepID=A0ABT4N3Y7_GORRU|nr:hypothetical protein [Gordonia rubripertincta]MCZ4553660.1 hypothetical protein [Gordonia rubripertincta]
MTSEPAWALRYPELFEGLSEQQKWNVHNNIANHVMEGWKPARENIADLVALERGDIDTAEYVRRGRAYLAAKRSPS